MNRRGFLKGLTAVISGIALNEAIPFGRVWSFPKEITIARPEEYSVIIETGPNYYAGSYRFQAIEALHTLLDIPEFNAAFGSQAHVELARLNDEIDNWNDSSLIVG